MKQLRSNQFNLLVTPLPHPDTHSTQEMEHLLQGYNSMASRQQQVRYK